jgi:hypothetical protein
MRLPTRGGGDLLAHNPGCFFLSNAPVPTDLHTRADAGARTGSRSFRLGGRGGLARDQSMAPLSWDNCVVLRALDTAPIDTSIGLFEAVECRDGRRIPPLPTTLASRTHTRRLRRSGRQRAGACSSRRLVAQSPHINGHCSPDNVTLVPSSIAAPSKSAAMPRPSAARGRSSRRIRCRRRKRRTSEAFFAVIEIP